LVSFTRDDPSFATRDDLSFALPGAANLTPSAGLSTCLDRIRLCASRRYVRDATM